MFDDGEIIRLGNGFFSGKDLCKSKLVVENPVCLWKNHVELMKKWVGLYRHHSKHLNSEMQN